MWFRRWIFGEWKRRYGRVILTAGGIAFAVAAYVSISISVDTARTVYERLYENVSGPAALEIVAETGGSFSVQVLEKVRDLPGVESAVPVIQRHTVIYFADKRVKILALGIDLGQARIQRDYLLDAGCFAAGDGQIMLDRDTARAIGVAIGDEVKLLTRRGLWHATVVGVVASRVPSALSQSSVVILDLADAQRVFKIPRQIDCIKLFLESGAAEEDVQVQLKQSLSAGLRATAPAARNEMAKEALTLLSTGLSFTTALAVIASVILVLNTFLVSAFERQPQVALLRMIGATRQQVVFALVFESVALGILGSGVGAAGGLVMARFVTMGIAQFLHFGITQLIVSQQHLTEACTMGLLLSLVATALPVWRASSISPLECMRSTVNEESEVRGHRMAVMGIIGLVVCVLFFATVHLGVLPATIAPSLIAIGVGAVVLLVPEGIALSSCVMSGLFTRVFQIEGKLAVRQCLRTYVRTSASVATVLVALTLCIGVGNTVMSNIDDIDTWLERTWKADFFVRGVMPDLATGLAADIPTEVAEEIRELPGIASIEPVRYVKGIAEDCPVIIITRAFAQQSSLPLDLPQDDVRDVQNRLVVGEVVIGEVLAKRTGIGKGQFVRIGSREGTRSFRVAATTTDYWVGGHVVYMDLNVAQKTLGIDGVDAFVIHVEPGARADVGAALAKICDRRGLLLQSFAELKAWLDELNSGALSSLWMILALAMLGPGLAVMSALTMNMLEQTRELGLLRVVGMTPWQIRKFVLLQALVIVLLGVIPAATLGVAVAFLGTLVEREVVGHTVEFTLHARFVVWCIAASSVLLLCAAGIPAERAARLTITKALDR